MPPPPSLAGACCRRARRQPGRVVRHARLQRAAHEGHHRELPHRLARAEVPKPCSWQLPHRLARAEVPKPCRQEQRDQANGLKVSSRQPEEFTFQLCIATSATRPAKRRRQLPEVNGWAKRVRFWPRIASATSPASREAFPDRESETRQGRRSAPAPGGVGRPGWRHRIGASGAWGSRRVEPRPRPNAPRRGNPAAGAATWPQETVSRWLASRRACRPPSNGQLCNQPANTRTRPGP